MAAGPPMRRFVAVRHKAFNVIELLCAISNLVQLLAAAWRGRMPAWAAPKEPPPH